MHLYPSQICLRIPNLDVSAIICYINTIMTGEAPQVQSESQVGNKESKLIRVARKAGYVAVGAVLALAGSHALQGGEETPRSPQAASNAAASPEAHVPSAGAKATRTTTPEAAPTTSPEAPPTAPFEIDPGFGDTQTVKTGDKLYRANGVVVLDTINRKGGRAHVAIANPAVRNHNGAIEFGVQPMVRKVVNGAGAQDGATALTWVSTKYGGPVEGGQLYYNNSTSPDKLVTPVTVLGTSELSVTQSQGSPFRTAIMASEIPGAKMPSNLPALNTGYNFTAVPQMPEQVVGFKLTDIPGGGHPWQDPNVNQSPFFSGQVTTDNLPFKVPQ